MNKNDVKYRERMSWLDRFAEERGRKPMIMEIVEEWGIGRSAAYNYLKIHGKLDKMNEMTPYEVKMQEEMWEIRDKLLEMRKERGFVFTYEAVTLPNMQYSKFLEYPDEIQNIATKWSDYKLAHKMNDYYDFMKEFTEKHGVKPTSNDVAKFGGKGPRNAYMFIVRHGEPLLSMLDLKRYNKE